MPAIPVMARRLTTDELAEALTRQGIFERGDHIYLQTPVQRFSPSSDQIEEFAFSKAVKQNAPNENLVWFKGSYVEADNPNGNGAMWKADELAIKSLTPMLMPVTIMHDPRTAVGTIADVKMLTPQKDKVPRARIDTVLALWGHRFPEAVQEAEVNAASGALMQSMECYSPWYECSECGQVFHKLPKGAEQANWCEHLRASNPNGGFVDLSQAANGSSENASRILGDVCFTGTGLIFGTRGAKGAYSEAHLESFEDELANYHQSVHTATATTRSANGMGLVQIEQSELDTLRKERDDARSETATVKQEKAEAERAAAEAETAKTKAETEKAEAEQKLTAANEEKARLQLRDDRFGTLGTGFVAKLGDFTKSRLQEQAGTLSDEEWENRLKELEEVTAVKRDAKEDEKDGEGDPKNKGKDGEGEGGEEADLKGTMFDREEVARLGVGGNGGQPESGEASPRERSQVIGSLAGAFKPPKETAGAK
jgi:hypothetical protein